MTRGEANRKQYPKGRVDPDTAPAGAFGLADELPPFHGSLHDHRRHQLLFADRGTMWVEAGGQRWLIPPQQAVWIAGGTRHRVTAPASLSLRTVYFEPGGYPTPAGTTLVLDVLPVAREMLLYAMRWGADRDPGDALAERYFGTLAALVEEWARAGRPITLPLPESEELERLVDWLVPRLDEEPTLEEAAAVVHVSSRTLTRRLRAELGTSWRDYLRRVRLARAAELLVVPGAQVTQVALEVGFRSPAAFSRAFKGLTGETPRGYRARRQGAQSMESASP